MTTPKTDNRRLIPGSEARSDWLGGIGWTKYCELINEGQLERVYIGRRSFVTAESLEGFLERLRDVYRPKSQVEVDA